MNLSETCNNQPRFHPWQGFRLGLRLHKTPNIGTPNYNKPQHFIVTNFATPDLTNESNIRKRIDVEIAARRLPPPSS